jgi:hypothetical protein
MVRARALSPRGVKKASAVATMNSAGTSQNKWPIWRAPVHLDAKD